MRRLRALLLVPALLALLAGGAASGGVAQGATRHPGLDRSFGDEGVTTVTLPKDEERFDGFQVTRGGRSYVLDNNQLLAFQSNGKVAAGFGEGGRIILEPDFAVGEGGSRDLAVDSQGRILITGSADRPGQKVEEAYVIRLLPDGSRDPEFGTDGEVDTDFGLPAVSGQGPSVSATAITVDAQDRPVVGGSFAKEAESCGYTLSIGSGPDPFVARLTATGALDQTFAGSGHAVLKGPGGVTGLAPLPGGGLAIFSDPCATPPRYEARNSNFSAFTESGEATPTAREVALPFSYASPLIDPEGRLVELESVPPAAEGVDAVARCLPDGDPDPGFGPNGRVILRHKPHYGSAIAVDAQSRPIIALDAKRIVLRRYRPDGQVDRAFGPGGKLTAKGQTPSAIGLDAHGRIYTVSLSRDPEHTTVQVARFIPGS